MALRVNEIFVSIQGETSRAGFPSLFIRLAGCNLRCRFCHNPELALNSSDLETVPETPDGQAPALNLESLEQDLTRLEELLYQALCADLPPETAESVDAETSAALKPHRKRMEADVYRQTFENYRARQLRLMYAVPRLSLFYLCPE